MSFELYDYRTTNRNVLVTPEIRARLYHMKPGQVDRRHSHDLGHEIFLILEGEAEFEINGVKKVLGPGQMCVALADEIHQVRNHLPDRPTIMYLSVTPHIQPTHTDRGEDGRAAAPNFAPNTNYHVEEDKQLPVSTLIDRYVDQVETLSSTVEASVGTKMATVKALRQAVADGDLTNAAAARDTLWEALYSIHKELFALDSVWNELAPRAAAEPQ